MSKRWRIAVLGATGLVGETVIKLLEERRFPVSELHPLASERALGQSVHWHGKRQAVLDAASFEFARADLAIFCAGEAASREYVPKAAAGHCVVIDHSAQFRLEADVPLVVPEVNPHALASLPSRRLIASPSAACILMGLALKPLQDAAGLERVRVASLQAVSGAGREGIEELALQTAELLQGRGPVKARVLPAQIAFNCVPQIDRFEGNGHTRDEVLLVGETRRILGDDTVRVSATSVQVPVFFGHSLLLGIETRRSLSAAEARTLLEAAPGVEVKDEHRARGYPTAALEAANRDTVYVGSIREDMSHDRGLDLWIVADNVRKGAATNSVQIAEILVRDLL